MRPKVYLGILVAIAVVVAIAVSACSASPPSNPPAAALDWDRGSWDTTDWK